jgi:hypothetical protein
MKYGGGLQLTYGPALISYAASYHPDLGFSQTLSLSFGLPGNDPQNEQQDRGVFP